MTGCGNPRVTASVIVPVRNGRSTLPACLDALAGQELPPGVAVEVIVVDNGSTDAHQRHRPRRIRRGAGRERDAGRARTPRAMRGLAVATGDVLAFTDADCIPAAGLAAPAGSRGCSRMAPTSSPVTSARGSADAPSLWERFDAGHHVDQRKYVEALGFGATANLFVRRSVLDARRRVRRRDGIGRRPGAVPARRGGGLSACVRPRRRRRARARGAPHGRPGCCIAGWAQAFASCIERACSRRGGVTIRCCCRSDGPPRSPAIATRRYRQREMLPLAALIVGSTGGRSGDSDDERDLPVPVRSSCLPTRIVPSSCARAWRRVAAICADRRGPRRRFRQPTAETATVGESCRFRVMRFDVPGASRARNAGWRAARTTPSRSPTTTADPSRLARCAGRPP